MNSQIKEEILEKRLNICKDCANNKLGVCTKCGCVIKLKAWFLGEQCPIGLWNFNLKTEE
jgi:hypothetical protein